MTKLKDPRLDKDKWGILPADIPDDGVYVIRQRIAGSWYDVSFELRGGCVRDMSDNMPIPVPWRSYIALFPAERFPRIHGPLKVPE